MEREMREYLFNLYLIIIYTITFALPAEAQIIVPSTHNISGTDNYIEITKPSGTAGDVLILDSSGKLGVSNTTPLTTLDVGGEIKLGNNNIVCDSTTEGSLRYSSANTELELCNGTGWAAQPLPCDGDLDAITFEDLTGHNPYSQALSHKEKVTGTTCDMTVYTTGGAYRICNPIGSCGSWTSSSNTISNGDYLQLKAWDMAVDASSVTVTAYISNTAVSFTASADNIATPKRAFKTAAIYTGNLGGVAGADSICQADADAAGLSGTYLAWVSDAAATDPDSRFTKSTTPYTSVTYTSIYAIDWTGLADGKLNTKIVQDASGTSVGATTRSWTNVDNAGQNEGSVDCNNWTDDSAGNDGVYGLADPVYWTVVYGTTTANDLPCNYNHAIMCFEQ
jgi:hypothetical protein